MPKLSTHWILAEDIRRRIPKGWATGRAVCRYPNLFRYGAAAPDTPFFLVWGPGSRLLNRQAEAFHECGGGFERFLAAALPGGGAASAEKRLALAAGILTHAAADAVFHPMIYYFAGSGSGGARWRHHRMEGYIDLFFSRNFLRSDVPRLEQILRGLEVDAATLFDWLARLFLLDHPRRRPYLRQALWCNVLFLKLFGNRAARLAAGWAAPAAPDGLKAYLAHFYPYRLAPVGRLFPGPIAFCNPATGHPCRMRIEEMGRAAVDTAFGALERIEAGERRLPALLPGGWNLHTGRADLPKAAMRFFDTDRPLGDILGLDPGVV